MPLRRLPMKTFLSGLLFLSILWAAAGAYQTRSVFIMVIDGSRYTETFGDPTHQYIPRIWNQLRPLAAIYTKCYNNGYTETCPGHSTILTGAYQYITNDVLQRPRQPTVF